MGKLHPNTRTTSRPTGTKARIQQQPMDRPIFRWRPARGSERRLGLKAILANPNAHTKVPGSKGMAGCPGNPAHNVGRETRKAGSFHSGRDDADAWGQERRAGGGRERPAEGGSAKAGLGLGESQK